MADVRSMLRSELAGRRAPSANSSALPSNSAIRKRKVRDDDDRIDSMHHKKEKLEPIPPSSARARTTTHGSEVDKEQSESERTLVSGGSEKHVVDQSHQAKDIANIDEDWEAFNREIAELPSAGNNEHPIATRYAAPTIEAAPVSAADLASQARQAQSVQQDPRKVELAEEKDEAARRAEEELEELEAYEMRARRLREKREALLRRKAAAVDPSVRNPDTRQYSDRSTVGPITTKQPSEAAILENVTSGDSREGNAVEHDDNDDSDDEDNDDWYMWRSRDA